MVPGVRSLDVYKSLEFWIGIGIGIRAHFWEYVHMRISLRRGGRESECTILCTTCTIQMNKAQLALLASSQTNDLLLDYKAIGIVLTHGNGTSKRQTPFNTAASFILYHRMALSAGGKRRPAESRRACLPFPLPPRRLSSALSHSSSSLLSLSPISRWGSVAFFNV